MTSRPAARRGGHPQVVGSRASDLRRAGQAAGVAPGDFVARARSAARPAGWTMATKRRVGGQQRPSRQQANWYCVSRHPTWHPDQTHESSDHRAARKPRRPDHTARAHIAARPPGPASLVSHRPGRCRTSPRRPSGVSNDARRCGARRPDAALPRRRVPPDLGVQLGLHAATPRSLGGRRGRSETGGASAQFAPGFEGCTCGYTPKSGDKVGLVPARCSRSRSAAQTPSHRALHLVRPAYLISKNTGPNIGISFS